MKKFLISCAVLLIASCAFGYNYDDKITDNLIKENQTVNFCADKNIWGKNCKGALQFTKRNTTGSGGYSEYILNKKGYDTDTVYEFVINDRLIGYNPYKLKFYYLEFKNDGFYKVELNENEIKTLFPDVEIVKISEFKDNKITLYKPFLKTKTFLLVNDTNKEFYKYQFEKYKNQTELIKGIFEPKRKGKYIFSHFKIQNEMYPALTIVVKNKAGVKK